MRIYGSGTGAGDGDAGSSIARLAMAESKIFELNGIDVQQVAEGVEGFLRNEKKMEGQRSMR